MTARSSTHGYPSQSTTDIGSYPDGYLSGSLLKDGDSPTMTAQCQPISGLQPDCHPSESMANIGFYLDGYHRGVS